MFKSSWKVFDSTYVYVSIKKIFHQKSWKRFLGMPQILAMGRAQCIELGSLEHFKIFSKIGFQDPPRGVNPKKMIFNMFQISYHTAIAQLGLKWLWPLYKWKKNRLDYRVHAPSPKILPKKCTKSAFQTKPAKFDTFWPISRDSMHSFQNRFLHWNRELKPVVLSTINPINRMEKIYQ